MENIQKRVLHRKAFFLSENLELSDKFCKEAVRQGLLSPADLAHIKSQSSHYECIGELITLICATSAPGFEKFCYLLDRIGLGFVSDELNAELNKEKNTDLPAYMVQESHSLLAHPLDRKDKKHTQRRLVDKDEIVKIAATRFAVGKEIGRLIANRKIAEVNREKLSVLDDIDKVDKVLDKILCLYGNLLTDNPPTTKDSTQTSTKQDNKQSVYQGPAGYVMSYSEKLRQLEDKARSLIAAYEGLLTINDSMMKERAKCFYLMGLCDAREPSAETAKRRLDQDLQRLLATSSVELDKTRLDVITKEEMAKALEVEVNALKLENDLKMKYMQRENEVLIKKVTLKDADIADLKEELTAKDRNEKVLNTKLEELRKRCEMLENTRRIGYFSESLNGLGDETDKNRNKDLFQLQVDKANLSARFSQVMTPHPEVGGSDSIKSGKDSTSSTENSRPHSGTHASNTKESNTTTLSILSRPTSVRSQLITNAPEQVEIHNPV